LPFRIPASDFPCPRITATLSPANATQVHPSRISVVMAMGDSMTAGFAARSILNVRPSESAPLEFRSLSFSGGKGGESSWTLPYFLRHYNSSLEGFSSELVSRFEAHLRSALDRILHSFSKIIVQLVSIFSLGSVKRARASHSWCDLRPKLLVECNCLDRSVSGEDYISDKQLDRLDDTVAAFNSRLHIVAQDFNLQRPDFTVIEAVAGQNQATPDVSYLSKLDCFHPSAKAHATLARTLWNNLFETHRVPLAFNHSVPVFCPNAQSVIYVDTMNRVV